MALSLLAGAMILPAATLAIQYDIVINNGRVMDPETKYDQVAIVGGEPQLSKKGDVQ